MHPYTLDLVINILFQVQSSATLNQYGGQSFMLADYTNYSAWTTLFDKYRINHVVLKFDPTGIQLNTQTGVTAPEFATALDFDNAATPGSFDTVIRKERSTLCNATTAFERKFVPRVSREVYYNGVTPGYEEAQGGVWLDCSNASIPHFGLVYVMGTATNTSYTYRVQAVYNVTFAFPIG